MCIALEEGRRYNTHESQVYENEENPDYIWGQHSNLGC